MSILFKIRWTFLHSMTDEDIINEFKTKRYRINPNLIKYYDNKCGQRFNEKIYDYVMNRYDDSSSFRESLCRILFGIEIHPTCPICNKKIPFKWSLNYKIFNDCCSQHCNNIYLNKIGKLNTKESIRKANESRIKTLSERYGVENSFQLDISKQKIKESNLKKYGVYPYSKTNEFKNFIKENISSINGKRYETMKKNHTFNFSKPEEELFLYIKSKFPSVKRQYKDKERYPYYCDFYIQELDYFIELQGYYTHGKHPYDPNSIEDQILVERYKSKYGPKCQAITIWTIKDVEKRNCAKEHNINFKEVWTLDDGKQFIDQLYEGQLT